eukprot:CAMPEP_0183452564 /NCGR_PEP_ID=MMETSP0370-20130417/118415_1 /TAXON_ID=268820 /ORGANISM="Peridinium aciculiferum, Strain PAER-2" /LENGTH=38 /DNA_ID= /DNA_START= /DNA_END= /DNA_ORIENTATION=
MGVSDNAFRTLGTTEPVIFAFSANILTWKSNHWPASGA